MSQTPCQHTMADLAVLARGGRCPSCHATLTPEEFREVADTRDLERIRALEFAVERLRAETDDLKRAFAEIEDLKHRLDRLEGKRPRTRDTVPTEVQYASDG